MSTDTLLTLRGLIIDDQRTMRSIVRRLLSQLGIIDVMEAAGGAEAFHLLEAAGEKSPDFVICDLHMEDGDGMTFCNKIRRHKNQTIAQIPILVLTGDSDNFLHEVALQIGAVNVLTKPISAPELAQGINRAVGFVC